MVSRATAPLSPSGGGPSTAGRSPAFLSLMGRHRAVARGEPGGRRALGYRQLPFRQAPDRLLSAALIALIAASFLDARQSRRVALIVLGLMLVLMLAVALRRRRGQGRAALDQPRRLLAPAVGVHEAGLRRHLRLAVRREHAPARHPRQRLRPDPARHRRRASRRPAGLRPDDADPRRLGRAVLHGRHAVAVDRRHRRRWASAACVAAYTVFPHVAGRIDRFLAGEGDTFQVDTGRDAVIQGGWFGVGPGEGTVKRILPDAHTDFIFAVAGEEFGIILCLLIMAIFAFVVLRGLMTALKEEDAFTRFAAAGLVVLFGVQSVINMAVNLQLMPAKGMTLPFISYGGSSMIAIAFAMGLVLALTRRRPEKRKTGRLRAHARPHAAGRRLMPKGTILLAAGGTGGHLFPAEALAHEMVERGWKVHLATDDRVERFAGHFPATEVHPIPSATFGSRNPFAAGAVLLDDLARRAPGLRGHPPHQAGGRGRLRRLSDHRRRSMPPPGAACPTIVHEQNAVIGRANRVLAARGRCDRRRLPARRVTASTARRPSSPAIRCGRRCCRPPARPITPDATASRSGCSSSAAARARGSSPTLVPAAIALRCRRRAARASSSRSRPCRRCRPRQGRLCRARHGAGGAALLHRHARAHRRRASRRSRARAPRPSSEISPSSAGRPSWFPIPMRSTTTRRPMPRRSPRPAAAEVDPQSTLSTERLASPHRRGDIAARPAGIHGFGGQIRGETGRCAVARRPGRGDRLG